MDDNRTKAAIARTPTEEVKRMRFVVPEITRTSLRSSMVILKSGSKPAILWTRKEDHMPTIRDPASWVFRIASTHTLIIALNSNDQDSLNFAAGGNFLDKMPRECLKIIESKSKVRQSRSKPIVSKVSTSSSTPVVSSDVAELKDMVRALILDKKNQTPAPAPVKAVEQSCVTCRGGHSYQNCTATNDYRDNIQEYVSQAATV
ncbi:hypothetical protein Tco_1155222 [Tanacetum coccineum]